MLIGTPHYMAPEQITTAAEVDARADVWAMGVILYEMLAGETPFEAEDGAAVMKLVRTRTVQPLRKVAPLAPAKLEELVLRCLDRDRKKRYADASVVRIELDKIRTELKKATRKRADTLPENDELDAPPRVAPLRKRPSTVRRGSSMLDAQLTRRRSELGPRASSVRVAPDRGREDCPRDEGGEARAHGGRRAPRCGGEVEARAYRGRCAPRCGGEVEARAYRGRCAPRCGGEVEARAYGGRRHPRRRGSREARTHGGRRHPRRRGSCGYGPVDSAERLACWRPIGHRGGRRSRPCSILAPPARRSARSAATGLPRRRPRRGEPLPRSCVHRRSSRRSRRSRPACRLRPGRDPRASMPRPPSSPRWIA